MKVLFLVQGEQRAILDRLYDGVAAACDCDLRWLSDDEQADLRRYFAEKVDLKRYQRIIFFLRFKKEIRQVGFIRSLPNLVILEHDACQNYLPGKYRGKFSAHYAALPGVRALVSGAALAERLRGEGVDAVFVPKGYDQALLHNAGGARDIELAFVGSTGSAAYSGRRAMLEAIGREQPLQVLKTASGDEYCATLNRIRYFVSADVGLGEYMIKNFEALACGCVLFAWRQGNGEEEALGLRDMENVVLYGSPAELGEKLATLRADPALAERIAAAGEALARQRYSFAALGRRIVEALEKPLNPQPPLSFYERLRASCHWLP